MATRTKTKGKPRKAVGRRKTAAGKKTKTKEAAKKQGRRLSPKKTSPVAKVIEPAPPETATPTPSAEGAGMEERVGVVAHYYNHLSVATIRLESGRLHVGDLIHIRGHTSDFSQKVESIEVDHAAVTEVGPNEEFGVKVVELTREHDVVFKVHS
jgi:hypothetical protein